MAKHIYLNWQLKDKRIAVEGDIPAPSTWPKLPRREQGSLPIRAGLYALWNEDEIVYVGESDNILERIGGHATKGWDTVSYLPVDGFERVVWEKILLRIYFPRLNKEFQRHNHRMRIKEVLYADQGEG